MESSDKIFELCYCWYDDYKQILFTGPHNISEKEFNDICKSIVPEAGKLAIKNDTWVGWREVLNCMADLLKEKGFKKFTPKRFVAPSSLIIRKKELIRDAEYSEANLLGDSLDLISEHNDKMEESYWENMSMEEYGLDEGIPPKNS